MNRGARSRRLLLLLILIVTVAGGGYLLWERRGGAPAFPLAQATATVTPTPVPRQFVVVARIDITAGTKISPSFVETRPLPVGSFPEDVIIDPTRAFGQIAVTDLAAGQPIAFSDVVSPESYVPPTATPIVFPGSLAARLLEPGQVAIAVPLDRLSGVAFALRPGDHVDVVTATLLIDVDQAMQARLPDAGLVLVLAQDPETGQYRFVPAGEIFPGGTASQDVILDELVYVLPSEDQRPRLVTQLTIQNAVVLGVGPWPLQPERGTATPMPVGGQPTPANAPTPTPARPDMVTLAVSPQEAAALEFMFSMGADVTFLLRGVGDESQHSTEAMTLEAVMERFGIPVPAKLPVVIDYPTPGPPTPTPSPIPPED